MIEILNYLKIGVGVVLLFGATIFVHEFGHYWVARRRKLKVEAFAIGFGPKIFSWVRDGIEYSVRWIPAGGYVKLPQMVTSTAIEGESGKEEIPPAPPFSKILVAFAGPFMNVVFAFAIASLIYWVGLPVLVNPSKIGFVEPGSDEAKLGIQPGDKIVAVDGQPVKSWEEVFKVTMLALTNVVPVAIEHEGRTSTYHLKAQASKDLDIKMLNLSPSAFLVVDEVIPKSAAEKAHLQVGDQIVEFAGVAISSSPQFTNLLQKYPDHPASIVVMRNHVRLPPLSITPELNPQTKVAKVGIRMGMGKDIYVLEHPTPWAQVSTVVDQVIGTLSALLHSHSSGVKASDLTGPVGIMSFLVLKVNTDYRLALDFLVMLNINLAIINLFPIPVLDGGHIMMSVLERIRRRPLDVRLVEYTTTVFAVLILSFFAYITYFDVKRLPVIRVLFNQESQIEQPAKPAAAPAIPGQ
jgi:regulator of sigma E protease